MAISTYTELKEEIIDWTHRDDIDLKIPNFILLAEQEAYNPPRDSGISPLKTKQQETNATLTTSISTRLVSLPSDFIELRGARLEIVDVSGYITYQTPEQMIRLDDTDVGRPYFFTIIGSQIEFNRISDEAYDFEITYYQKEPSLTAAAPTNDLLTNHPDVYLYGALYKAFSWAQMDDQAAKFRAMFYSAIDGANRSDDIGRFSPAPTMSVDGPTP